jgi:DNA-binding transcriptional regulator YiaG
MQIYWTGRFADSIVKVNMKIKERHAGIKKPKILKPKGASRKFQSSRSSMQLLDKRQLLSAAGTKFANSILGRRERALAEKLVEEVEKTDNSDVLRLCDTYGLKREDLGRLTGFSLRALAEWSAGRLPSTPARRRLHEVRRLLDALAEVVRIEAIPNWLGQRNSAFDNMTPLQVIELGEVDRLWQMVYELGSGNPD